MKHFGLSWQDVFIILSGFPQKKKKKFNQERGESFLCCFPRLKSENPRKNKASLEPALIDLTLRRA